jgi:hypothetical protein
MRGSREDRETKRGDSPFAIRRVPCLALRENTERPVTVTQGTNTVVGRDPERIVTEAMAILDSKGKAGRVPELCPSINSGCCARMDGRQSTL